MVIAPPPRLNAIAWVARAPVSQRLIAAIGSEQLRKPLPQFERVANQPELGQTFVCTGENLCEGRAAQICKQSFAQCVIDGPPVIRIDQCKIHSS